MVITHIPFVSDVQLAEAHAKAERQRRVAERHVAVLKRSRRHPALGYLSLHYKKNSTPHADRGPASHSAPWGTTPVLASAPARGLQGGPMVGGEAADSNNHEQREHKTQRRTANRHRLNTTTQPVTTSAAFCITWIMRGRNRLEKSRPL